MRVSKKLDVLLDQVTGEQANFLIILLQTVMTPPLWTILRPSPSLLLHFPALPPLLDADFVCLPLSGLVEASEASSFASTPLPCPPAIAQCRLVWLPLPG